MENKLHRPEDLADLWLQVIDGNREAFRKLHHILYPLLFAYSFKMTKSEEQTDDLLQDLFLKFWQNASAIGPLQNVKAYFYKSARFSVLNHLKDVSGKALKLLQLPGPEIEFSKEEIIVNEEVNSILKQKIHTAISTLPKKQREVIYMRFYDNLEYVQISEITGIRYQSVVNHVYRAVQLLRDMTAVKTIFAA